MPAPASGDVLLRAVRGPHDDRLTEPDALVSTAWTVLRPVRPGRGPAQRAAPRAPATPDRQLPSAGTVRGAIQVPPSGAPVVLLADGPLTGGYPVAAVLLDADVDRAAQVRPGQGVRLTWA
ncbi:MAG: hypothetical protein PGN07_11675 [Aeromicrobium erythreum]